MGDESSDEESEGEVSSESEGEVSSETESEIWDMELLQQNYEAINNVISGIDGDNGSEGQEVGGESDSESNIASSESSEEAHPVSAFQQILDLIDGADLANSSPDEFELGFQHMNALMENVFIENSQVQHAQQQQLQEAPALQQTMEPSDSNVDTGVVEEVESGIDSDIEGQQVDVEAQELANFSDDNDGPLDDQEDPWPGFLQLGPTIFGYKNDEFYGPSIDPFIDEYTFLMRHEWIRHLATHSLPPPGVPRDSGAWLWDYLEVPDYDGYDISPRDSSEHRGFLISWKADAGFYVMIPSGFP